MKNTRIQKNPRFAFLPILKKCAAEILYFQVIREGAELSSGSLMNRTKPKAKTQPIEILTATQLQNDLPAQVLHDVKAFDSHSGLLNSLSFQP